MEKFSNDAPSSAESNNVKNQFSKNLHIGDIKVAKRRYRRPIFCILKYKVGFIQLEQLPRNTVNGEGIFNIWNIITKFCVLFFTQFSKKKSPIILFSSHLSYAGGTAPELRTVFNPFAASRKTISAAPFSLFVYCFFLPLSRNQHQRMVA